MRPMVLHLSQTLREHGRSWSWSHVFPMEAEGGGKQAWEFGAVTASLADCTVGAGFHTTSYQERTDMNMCPKDEWRGGRSRVILVLHYCNWT